MQKRRNKTLKTKLPQLEVKDSTVENEIRRILENITKNFRTVTKKRLKQENKALVYRLLAHKHNRLRIYSFVTTRFNYAGHFNLFSFRF